MIFHTCHRCGSSNTTSFQWVDGYGWEYWTCWDCDCLFIVDPEDVFVPAAQTCCGVGLPLATYCEMPNIGAPWEITRREYEDHYEAIRREMALSDFHSFIPGPTFRDRLRGTFLNLVWPACVAASIVLLILFLFYNA